MRYSKQRSAILDCIETSYNHPTADMVYQAIKKDIPSISLGTIYRNLNSLSELGLIRKIVTPDDKVSFDKKGLPHNHIHCEKCHTLYDISDKEFNLIEENVLKETGHKLNSTNSIFVGICHNCLRKEEE